MKNSQTEICMVVLVRWNLWVKCHSHQMRIEVRIIIYKIECIDMNKKVLVGIAVALVIVAIGIVGAKAMLGDAKTEMPYEEQTEKVVGLQEKLGATESGKSAESGQNEANEKQP